MVTITEVPNGTPLRRGGQYEEDSFFTAVIKSYSNSSHSPFSLFTKLAILLAVALAVHDRNPADMATEHLKAHKSEHSIINLIQTVIIKFLAILSPRISVSLALCLLIINWSFKPSIRNGLGAVVVIVMFSFLPSWTIYEYFVICELYYIFIVVRNPQYKMLIVLIAFIFILIDQDLIRTYFLNSSDASQAGSARYAPTRTPAPPTAAKTGTKTAPAATAGGVKGA